MEVLKRKLDMEHSAIMITIDLVMSMLFNMEMVIAMTSLGRDQ